MQEPVSTEDQQCVNKGIAYMLQQDAAVSLHYHQDWEGVAQATFIHDPQGNQVACQMYDCIPE
eukprot:3683016-Lingulodinium_polyedra.AAC.1